MAFQVNCEEIFFIDWKWTIYSYNKALFNRKYDWHLLYHTGVPRNHSNVVILFPELCISKIPQSGICPAPCAYLGHVALLSSKAKLNNKIILVDTLSPVYIQVYCISHVVFICFMSSLICVHAATDSDSSSMCTIIPFPVLMSNIHFRFFLILLVTFEVSSEMRVSERSVQLYQSLPSQTTPIR